MSTFLNMRNCSLPIHIQFYFFASLTMKSSSSTLVDVILGITEDTGIIPSNKNHNIIKVPPPHCTKKKSSMVFQKCVIYVRLIKVARFGLLITCTLPVEIITCIQFSILAMDRRLLARRLQSLAAHLQLLLKRLTCACLLSLAIALDGADG
jgi:hypothetical protein